jgi:signal transduction histidine kinase
MSLATNDIGSGDTRRLLDEPMRVCVDTMLEPFGAYESIRDQTGQIVDFEIVHVNEAACIDVGVPRDAQIGRRLCELFPPIRTTGYFEKYRLVVETGVPMSEDGFERGGRYWDMRVSRLGDGFVVSWRDVTARKQLEIELQRSLAAAETARLEAEAANQSKDQFLATMSHELRTPLTAVLGYVQMLQKGAVSAGRQAAVIETINRNAKLQLQLIDDILDVSGIVRGKLTLERERIDLNVVVADAVASLQPVADAKRIAMVLDIVAAEAPVTGDRRRLHQVFCNVLTNAVKFTPDGGRITIGLRSDSGAHQVEIADTGIGIDPAFLPRIFQRFTQGDSGPRRRDGGLGLGLNIAQFLVAGHGGTIAAESGGPGQGATFRIRLPLA